MKEEKNDRQPKIKDGFSVQNIIPAEESTSIGEDGLDTFLNGVVSLLTLVGVPGLLFLIWKAGTLNTRLISFSLRGSFVSLPGKM